MFDLDKPPLEELAHSGVKGMKWGQRKAESNGGESGGSSTKEKVASAGAAVKSGAKKTGQALDNYHKFRNETYLKGMWGGIFGNGRSDALKAKGLAAAEGAVLLAGAAAIKKIDMEVSVAKFRREMKKL